MLGRRCPEDLVTLALPDKQRWQGHDLHMNPKSAPHSLVILESLLANGETWLLDLSQLHFPPMSNRVVSTL